MKDHYDTSVFRFKDRRFWDPSISWIYVGYLRFTKYHPDAWHLFNSMMIIFFSLSITFHKAVLPWYCEVIIAGVVYNAVFNLFYNKILRKP